MTSIMLHSFCGESNTFWIQPNGKNIGWKIYSLITDLLLLICLSLVEDKVVVIKTKYGKSGSMFISTQEEQILTTQNISHLVGSGSFFFSLGAIQHKLKFSIIHLWTMKPNFCMFMFKTWFIFWLIWSMSLVDLT